MAKLMLFTGKGGVGKSTTSAASAYYWASKGYKTLLVSSDPAHSTEDVLGVPVTFEAKQIIPNLWAKNLNAKERANDFIEQMNSGLDSTFTKWFPGFDPELLSDWASFPGMDEVFALEELMHLVQGIEYDIVVFDTAPTGHTLKALTAPESINAFLMRILRMKAKIEGMKTMFIKKGDTSKLVKVLEQTTEMIKGIKELLRKEDFVDINLVSIATEAGYQECVKTITFLQTQGFTINNVIINNIIPTFDDKTWEMASTNKAVALLKMERENQLPYITQYDTLTKREGINLVGVSKLPFQPMGGRLMDFSKFLWKSGGVDFTPAHSMVVSEDETTIRVNLRFPHLNKVKLFATKYSVNGYTYDIPLPPQVEGWKLRKSKNALGASYVFRI
tara:strand:- start:244 stop:1410 length:1167 start_codon:yes stop_codon:yes gene_type:complete